MLAYPPHLIIQETRFLAIFVSRRIIKFRDSQTYLVHRSVTSLLILAYTKTKQYEIDGYLSYLATPRSFDSLTPES